VKAVKRTKGAVGAPRWAVPERVRDTRARRGDEAARGVASLAGRRRGRMMSTGRALPPTVTFRPDRRGEQHGNQHHDGTRMATPEQKVVVSPVAALDVAPYTRSVKGRPMTCLRSQREHFAEHELGSSSFVGAPPSRLV
jgi:hypothetical protein